VRRFLTEDGRALLALSWGTALFTPHGNSKTGVWLRSPRAPALPPWQSPLTWGELRRVCQQQGIQLDQFIRRVARHLRGGDSHLLAGFPFPSKVGGPDEQMHWQAVELKPRDELTGWYPGFRPGNKDAIWLEMRQKLTGEREKIMWKDSQNWVHKELVARGALPAQLTERKVLLIGTGALGSVVAELLMRAGVHRITLLDGQDLRAGNLCRHTLTIQDLEKKKVEGLAKRLAGASPHAVVDAITSAFPPSKPEEIAKVQDCDLIIDCTAEDDVLQAMSVFPWNSPKVFASLSLGIAARRLFCFVTEGSRFPMQGFTAAIQPWLAREEAERGDFEWPREAPGCWSPVFPARIDDVWMLAAIAVKQLAAALESSFVTTGLTVFEQITENGMFAGVRRLSGEVDHHGSGILVAKPIVRPNDTGERNRQDASQVQGSQAQ
jgi:ThiF family